MIINFHEHPNDGLIEFMDKHAIDIAVLLPVGDENVKRAEKLAAKHPDRFIAFTWAGPAEDLDHAVDRFRASRKAGGGRGVKFQTMLQHCDPYDKRLFPLYEECAKHNAPLVFHCGVVPFEGHLQRYANPVTGIDQVAADFPTLPIVIAHLGGNFRYEAIIAAEKHKNIYMDTAFLHYFAERELPFVSPLQRIEHAVHLVGAERLLYGCEEFLPSELLGSRLSAEMKKQILGDNAEGLLEL